VRLSKLRSAPPLALALAAILPATALAQSGGAKTNPAGGAALGEVLLASGMAAVVTAFALAIIIGHRSGRLAWPGRVADYAARQSGMPGWAALPVSVVGGALLVAVIGMYWDISLHIDNGRDPGPLANPAHYLILFGLFGIFIAGLLAMALPKPGEKPSPTAVRLTNDWQAPLGGVLMTACSAFALSGFPLDDVWHRLFGQDVTLWGPTHLMLIGGASLCTLATLILVAEGTRAARNGRAQVTGDVGKMRRFRQASLAGALLVGLSTFQAEFDFSVPQFRLLYHPVLLMVAASIALVCVRIWMGRGGALMALAGYLAIRGLLAIYVSVLWGQTTLHFPLYAVEAIAVEGVALVVSTRRPVVFGAVAGAAIGTFGLAAEWGWSHVWMTMSWPASLLPEAAILGPIAAIAGGILGAAIGRALSSPAQELARMPRWSVVLAGVAVVAAIAYPLPTSPGGKVTAQIKLTDATGPPNRTVNAEVKLSPPDAADGAEWFNMTAWQGGGAVVEHLRQTGPGTYQTTEPLPVYGEWKSTIRLQSGNRILGLPLYMPDDPAIPAKGIPAQATMTRTFIVDKKNLQREQKSGVPGFLTLAAYLVVLAIVIGLMAALVIGIMRIDRDRDDGDRERPGAATGSRAATPA
jgi:hypothetical protein